MSDEGRGTRPAWAWAGLGAACRSCLHRTAYSLFHHAHHPSAIVRSRMPCTWARRQHQSLPRPAELCCAPPAAHQVGVTALPPHLVQSTRGSSCAPGPGCNTQRAPPHAAGPPCGRLWSASRSNAGASLHTRACMHAPRQRAGSCQEGRSRGGMVAGTGACVVVCIMPCCAVLHASSTVATAALGTLASAGGHWWNHAGWVCIARASERRSRPWCTMGSHGGNMTGGTGGVGHTLQPQPFAAAERLLATRADSVILLP